MYWAFQHYEELAFLREASKLAHRPDTSPFLIETSKRIDAGPTVGWLRNTIKKFGFKGAGKKVSTILVWSQEGAPDTAPAESSLSL
jgi:hypothetical protein